MHRSPDPDGALDQLLALVAAEGGPAHADPAAVIRANYGRGASARAAVAAVETAATALLAKGADAVRATLERRANLWVPDAAAAVTWLEALVAAMRDHVLSTPGPGEPGSQADQKGSSSVSQ